MSNNAIIPPIHPGEILMEEYLKPLGVTQHELAESVGVPPRRINEIVHGKRRITPDTALRLARYFSTSERFWLNLQDRYDVETERDRSSSRYVMYPPPARIASPVAAGTEHATVPSPLVRHILGLQNGSKG